MSAILRELLRVSEKAAHIARACRQQDALFQLLIEEKKGGDKNKKFAVDFKTLADVLVQEVIKRHVESKVSETSNSFQAWRKKFLEKKSNEFTNALGETIVLRLCPTEEEMAELLSKVLNGNQLAAGALAKVVHEDVAFADPALDSVQVAIPQDTLGIWVDPIDSTHQYIQGSADVEPSHGVFPRGLPCVTILIGVYDLHTGLPLMGVINQPFVAQDPATGRWEGRRYWGLSYMGTNVHSLLPPGSEPQTGRPGPQAEDTGPQAAGAPRFSAVISASERETVRAALARVCGGRVLHAAGAGYKGLCVVQGLVDVYVFSTTPPSSGTRARPTPSCGPWAAAWWTSRAAWPTARVGARVAAAAVPRGQRGRQRRGPLGQQGRPHRLQVAPAAGGIPGPPRPAPGACGRTCTCTCRRTCGRTCRRTCPCGRTCTCGCTGIDAFSRP
ncbi:hypothetical protein QTO34_002512 [Cnephaeus nilssonii]|uniref:Inositol polyphosphate 1-phosphatase n=1 Tax=Cnephaeus nilssonii TaxID=3371016 RepID=A0AA40HS99_CNENI|nr:hypothetical protein QTO34_002512 [Eptesicus nilssonii]